MKKLKYYLLPAIVCLTAIVALAYYYFLTPFVANNNQETTYVYISDNDTQESVLKKLQPIASSHSLTGLGTLMRHIDYDSHIRTGRFAIEAGMSTLDVLRRLKNGQQTPIMLTIPEVRTMPQLAARLSNKLMLDSAALAIRLTDDTIASLFVPDTYEVYWNMSVDAFLQRMQREHDAFWNSERRRLAAEKGLTPCQVCTLASIIDEETANNAEKPMIAGMYLNRLKLNMPLQADPTVKFAIGDFSLKRIYHTHLEVESPYNTYRNVGLPPGPIKIASQKGIDAVLHAVDHDYLYMCAKEDFSGTHNFAHTYREHQKNAARYAAALNKRGIK
jgi:UPF0755 protein